MYNFFNFLLVKFLNVIQFAMSTSRKVIMFLFINVYLLLYFVINIV